MNSRFLVIDAVLIVTCASTEYPRYRKQIFARCSFAPDDFIVPSDGDAPLVSEPSGLARTVAVRRARFFVAGTPVVDCAVVHAISSVLPFVDDRLMVASGTHNA